MCTETLERMIAARLEFWLGNVCPLPYNQFGFKKGFGTEDALGALVTRIHLCLSKNNYLNCLFLDVKGAYDSVNLEILEYKMVTNFSVPRHTAKAIMSLYKPREIYVRDFQNNLVGPRTNSIGLPQGSVLSPLLFNLYTADIHNLKDTKIVQYADDFCLFSEHKNYDSSLELLTNAFNLVSDWLLTKASIFHLKNQCIMSLQDTILVTNPLSKLAKILLCFKNK